MYLIQCYTNDYNLSYIYYFSTGFYQGSVNELLYLPSIHCEKFQNCNWEQRRRRQQNCTHSMSGLKGAAVHIYTNEYFIFLLIYFLLYCLVSRKSGSLFFGISKPFIACRHAKVSNHKCNEVKKLKSNTSSSTNDHKFYYHCNSI